MSKILQNIFQILIKNVINKIRSSFKKVALFLTIFVVIVLVSFSPHKLAKGVLYA